MTVPFVITPSWVYIGDCGFFLTPMIGSWKVALSSGCVTLAFFTRRAEGRMKRSSLGGFRVKSSPTKVALVTMRFHPLRLLFPVLRTLNISSSAIPRTLG